MAVKKKRKAPVKSVKKRKAPVKRRKVASKRKTAPLKKIAASKKRKTPVKSVKKRKAPVKRRKVASKRKTAPLKKIAASKKRKIGKRKRKYYTSVKVNPRYTAGNSKGTVIGAFQSIK